MRSYLPFSEQAVSVTFLSYRLSVAYPIKQHIRRSTVFSYTSIFTEFSVVIGELYSLY